MHSCCRYDDSTGVFTVPPGGSGWYYFSAFLRGDDNEYGVFDVTLNDNVICTTIEDTDGTTGSDAGQGGCGAVVFAVEGKYRETLKSFASQLSFLYFAQSLLSSKIYCKIIFALLFKLRLTIFRFIGVEWKFSEFRESDKSVKHGLGSIYKIPFVTCALLALR